MHHSHLAVRLEQGPLRDHESFPGACVHQNSKTDAAKVLRLLHVSEGARLEPCFSQLKPQTQRSDENTVESAFAGYERELMLQAMMNNSYFITHWQDEPWSRPTKPKDIYFELPLFCVSDDS